MPDAAPVITATRLDVLDTPQDEDEKLERKTRRVSLASLAIVR